MFALVSFRHPEALTEEKECYWFDLLNFPQKYNQGIVGCSTIKFIRVKKMSVSEIQSRLLVMVKENPGTFSVDWIILN